VKKLTLKLYALLFVLPISDLIAIPKGVAVAGTLATGAFSAANLYRVSCTNEYSYELGKSTRLGCAVVLGTGATIASAILLHRATPSMRLFRASSLVDATSKHYLLQIPYNTPQEFNDALQRYYARYPRAYAQAFKDLKNLKDESDKALELIEKARSDISVSENFSDLQNNIPGKYIETQARKNNEFLDHLLLIVKANPQFEQQITDQEKINEAKRTSNAAESVAAAQWIQAVNSFHRK
jgi:hypothetical protein